MKKTNKKTAQSGFTPSNSFGMPTTPRLWRLVLFTALSDIFIGKPRDRREAIHWFESEDFLEVCAEAQVAPGKLTKMAETLWGLPRDEQLNFLRQLRTHLEA